MMMAKIAAFRRARSTSKLKKSSKRAIKTIVSWCVSMMTYYQNQGIGGGDGSKKETIEKHDWDRRYVSSGTTTVEVASSVCVLLPIRVWCCGCCRWCCGGYFRGGGCDGAGILYDAGGCRGPLSGVLGWIFGYISFMIHSDGPGKLPFWSPFSFPLPSPVSNGVEAETSLLSTRWTSLNRHNDQWWIIRRTRHCTPCWMEGCELYVYFILKIAIFKFTDTGRQQATTPSKYE